MRGLVVANDVWDVEIVQKVRETGLSILLTSRNDSIVTEAERVIVAALTQPEAEEVLRREANITQDERLPDAALAILDRCDNVAMDVGFVCSWDLVRTGKNGKVKSGKEWARALHEIDLHVPKEVNLDASRDGALNVQEHGLKRRAILRGGFKYLAHEVHAQELFMALAVLPDSSTSPVCMLNISIR